MALTRNQQRRRGQRGSKTAHGFVFDFDSAGIDGLKELLTAMPQQMRNMILVPIVKKVTTEGSRIARRNLVRVLPNREGQKKRWDTPTGALRDSLGAKTVPTSRMRNKNVVFGLYGARLDFRVRKSTAANLSRGGRFVGRVKRGKKQPGLTVPAKYIHLVEFGHRGSRYYKPARPYPFMTPTRAEMESKMPGMVRAEFQRLYPLIMDRLMRRYMKRINAGAGRAA